MDDTELWGVGPDDAEWAFLQQQNWLAQQQGGLWGDNPFGAPLPGRAGEGGAGLGLPDNQVFAPGQAAANNFPAGGDALQQALAQRAALQRQALGSGATPASAGSNPFGLGGSSGSRAPAGGSGSLNLPSLSGGGGSAGNPDAAYLALAQLASQQTAANTANQSTDKILAQQAAQQRGTSAAAQTLFNQYQSKADQANNANIQRYNDTLGGWQARSNWAAGQLDQLSGQEKQDVNNRYDAQQKSAQQSLVSRGLGNTTVVDATGRGIENDRNAELRRVNDAKIQENLQTGLGTSADTLGFMERRTDQAPDFQTLASLALEAGKGGGLPATGSTAATGAGQSSYGVTPSQLSSGSPGAVPLPTNSPSVSGIGGGYNYQQGVQQAQAMNASYNTQQQTGLTPYTWSTGNTAYTNPNGIGGNPFSGMNSAPLAPYQTTQQPRGVQATTANGGYGQQHSPSAAPASGPPMAGPGGASPYTGLTKSPYQSNPYATGAGVVSMGGFSVPNAYYAAMPNLYGR